MMLSYQSECNSRIFLSVLPTTLIPSNMSSAIVRTSKFLSLVLRHKPEKIGIALDSQGWVAVENLISAMDRHGKKVDRNQLEEVVALNDKKRFEFSQDGERIRACQGHSVAVDLDLESLAPPAQLFHGTVERFLDSIMKSGLLKQSRQHVHLSDTREVALSVGARRGQALLLTIDASAMANEGYLFFRSNNGVWLTDHVPARFLQVSD